MLVELAAKPPNQVQCLPMIYSTRRWLAVLLDPQARGRGRGGEQGAAAAAGAAFGGMAGEVPALQRALAGADGKLREVWGAFVGAQAAGVEGYDSKSKMRLQSGEVGFAAEVLAVSEAA